MVDKEEMQDKMKDQMPDKDDMPEA
jgi:hypothetical protein